MERRTFLGGLLAAATAAFASKPTRSQPQVEIVSEPLPAIQPDMRVNWNSHPQPGVYRSQPFTPTGSATVYVSSDHGLTWSKVEEFAAKRPKLIIDYTMPEGYE